MEIKGQNALAGRLVVSGRYFSFLTRNLCWWKTWNYSDIDNKIHMPLFRQTTRKAVSQHLRRVNIGHLNDFA